MNPGVCLSPRKPDKVVCDILEKHSDLKLALARLFLPFRKPVSDDIILNVSKENSLFLSRHLSRR